MKSKIHAGTTLVEMGAIVCEALRQAGIDTFLSGGAVVSIYTNNQYESYDLDFISVSDHNRLKTVMLSLGFTKSHARYYTHANSEYFVEFPGAAMMVGDQPIKEFYELKLPQGTLKLLTPTDCVKDRLAAYYHWHDRQSLNQAVWVAKAQPVKLKEIRAWSVREGMQTKFKAFLTALKKSNE